MSEILLLAITFVISFIVWIYRSNKIAVSKLEEICAFLIDSKFEDKITGIDYYWIITELKDVNEWNKKDIMYILKRLMN